jgi:hypothetical protein
MCASCALQLKQRIRFRNMYEETLDVITNCNCCALIYQEWDLGTMFGHSSNAKTPRVLRCTW